MIIMFFNPQITGQYHPLYTLNNVSDVRSRAQRLCHIHFKWEFTIEMAVCSLGVGWIFLHFFAIPIDCLKKHEK